MERLTYWNEEYGCWSYKCASGDAAKCLAAYEDTGLTPEQIENQKQIVDSYAQSARVIALYLKDYCDEKLSYSDMIADAARKASDRIAALTADKDEQAGRIMQYESALKNMYFAYQNKDPDCPHDFEIKAIEQYNALLGGAEDAGSDANKSDG